MATSGDLPVREDSSAATTNPFATPQVEAVKHVARETTPTSRGQIFRRFGLWSLVCGISAIPSFFIAMGMTQHPLRVPAMIGGVLAWAVFYTFADTQFFAAHRRKNASFHKAMVTGFGIRVLISILLPAGASADILPGAISVGIVSSLFYGELGEYRRLQSLPAIFLTTVLQGALLNVLVWLVVLLIFTIMMLVSRGDSPMIDRPLDTGEDG